MTRHISPDWFTECNAEELAAKFASIGMRETDTVAELRAALQRCSFLLNSARLVIEDPHAKALAGAAVADANRILRRTA